MTRFGGGPADSPGFVLWHTTLAWQRRMTAVLAPLGLTHVQFVLLACMWWLDQRGSAPHQQELAVQSGTDVKMVSQVVRKLEVRGLIERTVDPADTRARVLRITPSGAALAADAIGIVEDVDAEFFGAHGTDLVDVLGRITTPHARSAAARRPTGHHGRDGVRPPPPAAGRARRR